VLYSYMPDCRVHYVLITRAKTKQRHNPDNAEEFISTVEIL